MENGYSKLKEISRKQHNILKIKTVDGGRKGNRHSNGPQI